MPVQLPTEDDASKGLLPPQLQLLLQAHLDVWASKVALRIALWFVVGGAALVASGVAAWVTVKRDVQELQREVRPLSTWRAAQDTLQQGLRYELRRLNERLDDLYATDLRRR